MAMGTLCFSSTPILRCELLSVIQYGVLIVPAGLELLFTNFLLIAFRGPGRDHLFLAAESWVSFILVLLDSLSHIIPAARESYAISSTLDTIVATLSFFPILLFLLFLYLFMRTSFIVALPQRLQNLAQMVLIISIPLIISVEEISSFIGVSRSAVLVGNTTTLTLGFTSYTNQLLWTFFTSFTLAIHSAFQFLCFFLAFYRVVKAVVNQRHIETSSIDAVHFMNGTGWIAGGLKIGAVETVVGFAQCGFIGAIIRRFIRTLSRAFLVIGMIKGLDAVEDFQWLERSKRRLIRKSSRAATRESGFDPRLMRISRSPDETFDISPRVLDSEKGERVTIHYEKGQAPTLLLRFSFLDLPTPSVFENSLKWDKLLQWPSSDDPAWVESKPNPLPLLIEEIPADPDVKPTHSRLGDNPVLGPGPRFPSLPPPAHLSPSSDQASMISNFGTPTPTPYTPIHVSPAVSLPSPSVPTTAQQTFVSEAIQDRSTPPVSPDEESHSQFGKSFISLTRSNTEVTSPSSPPFARRSLTPREPSFHEGITTSPSTYSNLSRDVWSADPSRKLDRKNDYNAASGWFSPRSVPAKSVQAVSTGYYYMDPPPTPTADTPYPHSGRVRLSGRVSGEKRDVASIKSIGKAPRRNTPTPTAGEEQRTSVAVERILSPQLIAMTDDDMGSESDSSSSFSSHP